MDTKMTGTVILTCLALGVLTVSAWMHINDKDGSGWGIVALCLIIYSCNRVN
jgi:hypothetical protein